MRLQFRICATCKNLEVQEQGREFPGIADTEYTVFRCNVLGWTSREDYLMTPVTKEIPSADPFECPYWEEFRPVRNQTAQASD